MRKTKLIVMIILLLLVLLNIINPTVKATINPGDYDPSQNPPDQAAVNHLTNIANPIIGTIKVVGIVVAVITLAVLGLKYMTGSVSEKAEYKKTMIPYLIGAFLVVATTQLIGVIIEIISGVTG